MYFARMRVTSFGGASFGVETGGAASANDPASADAPMKFRRRMEFNARRGLRSTGERYLSGADKPLPARGDVFDAQTLC